MKKHFKKELVITKCLICDNNYGNDVKVRDYCHITGKYRGAGHRDRNFNLKINPKIPVVFYILKIMSLIFLCKN